MINTDVSKSWESILSLIVVEPKIVNGLLFGPDRMMFPLIISLSGDTSLCLIQQILAPVSIVIGTLILLSFAWINKGSEIWLMLCIIAGLTDIEGWQWVSEELFNLLTSFLNRKFFTSLCWMTYHTT